MLTGVLSLKKLRLGCHELTDANIAHLRNAPLEDLMLEGCDKVSDEGLASLLEGKQLTKLNLCQCAWITEGVFLALRGLPLVKLELFGENFANADAAVMSLVPEVPSIAEVVLNSVNVFQG